LRECSMTIKNSVLVCGKWVSDRKDMLFLVVLSSVQDS
jgi:hypothetical protein